MSGPASAAPPPAPLPAPAPPAPFAERAVLPGDDVTAALAAVASVLRLGSGLAERRGAVVATQAGVLRHRPPNRFFVAANGRRYTPAVGDAVVGTVVERSADAYRVRINAVAVAQLPALAFDGASKRNKPNLAVGTLVFARVVACNRHLEPELSCQAASGPKKDWMTGQSVFGPLVGGTVLPVSLATARRLLDPECAVLTELGAAIPFEVAVGVNGVVWVQAAGVKETIAVRNAIAAEGLTAAQSRLLVRRVLQSIATG